MQETERRPMKKDWEIYRDTGILGGYIPEQAKLRQTENGEVATVFRDTTTRISGALAHTGRGLRPGACGGLLAGRSPGQCIHRRLSSAGAFVSGWAERKAFGRHPRLLPADGGAHRHALGEQSSDCQLLPRLCVACSLLACRPVRHGGHAVCIRADQKAYSA